MSLRRLTWTAYLLMVGQGFVLYAVGYLTPYLQSELGAPAWAAALPNSAMATGMLLSGLFINRVVLAIGPRAAIRLWIVLLAIAAVLMSLAVSIWPILVGAFVCGIANSGSLVHVISSLADRANGVYLMRATLFSVVGGVLGPIALSAAARTVGWSLGTLVPVPFLLVLAVIVPASPAREAAPRARGREPALGRPYWLTWLFLALCVATEFSFVAWGSQVAVERAGLALADATALGSLFVVGLILGRMALSTGLAAGRDLSVLLRGGTVMAATGGLLLWVAGMPTLAGAGMLLGGLGMSAVYPLASRLAVAHAPLAPVRASTRLTVATAISIFSAPFLLGLIAEAAGVITAFVLVLAFLLAALAVLWLIPRPRPPSHAPPEPAAAADAAEAATAAEVSAA